MAIELIATIRKSWFTDQLTTVRLGKLILQNIFLNFLYKNIFKDEYLVTTKWVLLLLLWPTTRFWSYKWKN